jgi:hypothetical protein
MAEPTPKTFQAFVAGLGAASTLAGTEPIPGVQGGASKTLTPAQIKAFIELGLAPYLTAYTERATLLVQSGATLTIPLDGRTFKVVPSETITTIALTAPAAPICGWATVDFVMGATPYAVSLPATWYTSDGVPVSIQAVANARTSLYLRSDFDGNVHVKYSNERLPT